MSTVTQHYMQKWAQQAAVDPDEKENKRSSWSNFLRTILGVAGVGMGAYGLWKMRNFLQQQAAQAKALQDIQENATQTGQQVQQLQQQAQQSPVQPPTLSPEQLASNPQVRALIDESLLNAENTFWNPRMQQMEDWYTGQLNDYSRQLAEYGQGIEQSVNRADPGTFRNQAIAALTSAPLMGYFMYKDPALAPALGRVAAPIGLAYYGGKALHTSFTDPITGKWNANVGRNLTRSTDDLLSRGSQLESLFGTDKLVMHRGAAEGLADPFGATVAVGQGLGQAAGNLGGAAYSVGPWRVLKSLFTGQMDPLPVNRR